MDTVGEKRCYVVQVRSGMEKLVKRIIKENIKNQDLDYLFGEIFLPYENVEEIRRDGKREVYEKLIFPGYIVLEMAKDDRAWHLVKKIPNVIAFLGSSASSFPSPMTRKDEERVRNNIPEKNQIPRRKVAFEIGESVRIKDGPFADFTCTVEEINYEKCRLRVAVTIFGRATPVDLSFDQVEKN